MLNVICVKIGFLYDADYVNRLLKMCRATISQPFTMYCYTDDDEDVDNDVVCIDYVNNKLSKPVFDKLYIFSSEFTHNIKPGKCIYFDLDVVLKKSVDFLLDPWSDQLRVIHTSWKDDYFQELGAPDYIHNINSSCMTWRSGYATDIWETFVKDKQVYMKTYNGMDQFLYFTLGVRGALPDKFHSHINGFNAALRVKYFDKQQNRIRITDNDNPLDNFPVCLLNGDTTIDDYMFYYKKYYND